MLTKLQVIKEKYKPLIPLLLLTCLSIYTITSFIYSIILNIVYKDNLLIAPNYYIVLVVLILNYLAFFFARKYYPILLVITLILGLFNIIDFTSIHISNTVESSLFKFSFQPIMFLFLGLIYILNFKTINGFIRKQFELSPEESIKRNEAFKAEKVEKFMDKFQHYSNDELETILTDNRYMSEAIEASKQLLKQRENKIN